MDTKEAKGDNMADSILTVFELAGFLFLSACVGVGAWVILRWGWCGVALLWQKRYYFDNAVRGNAKSTWDRDR